MVGELCLSPIGLSMVTKLAPVRLVGLGMGGWFLSTGIGNNLSGIFASVVSGETGMTTDSALSGYTVRLLGAGRLRRLAVPDRPIDSAFDARREVTISEHFTNEAPPFSSHCTPIKTTGGKVIFASPRESVVTTYDIRGAQPDRCG